jgi:hypothetical protein
MECWALFYFLTFSVVLCQKMAKRNVAATWGVRKLEMDWMYTKSWALLNAVMIGIQAMESRTSTTTKILEIETEVRQEVCLFSGHSYLPTMMSSTSVAFFRTSLQTSMVNRVDEELKMDVKEDIRAASMTANIRPRRPRRQRFEKGLRRFQRVLGSHLEASVSALEIHRQRLNIPSPTRKSLCT